MTQKLLLADDSITIQRVIELTFSGEDVDVVAVSDGEQAIARIPIEKPDIILADIGMPKRSGYEVAAFVKEHPDFAHIPVLLLAGAFEPVDEARATQVKCDGVLVKPFEPQHVISRVRELMRGVKPTDAGTVTREAGPETRDSIPAPRAEPTVDARSVQPPPETAPVQGLGPLTYDSPVAAASDPSVDDYFNRLDAAFATIGNTQTPGDAEAPDGSGTFGGRDVPTIDDVLAGASLRTPPAVPESPFGRVSPPSLEPPETAPTLAPAPRPPVVAQSGDRSGIADVFSLLFAVEQGERDPATIRITPPSSAPITDELVDQITRRVLERLAPGAARDVVADIVSDVAERLVREEIDRIRSQRP